jgi:hypothetical protein
MELADLIHITVFSCVSGTVGYFLNVNMVEFIDAAEYLENHPTLSTDFYKEKRLKRTQDNTPDKIGYYIGTLGRKLAYERHNIKRNRS